MLLFLSVFLKTPRSFYVHKIQNFDLFLLDICDVWLIFAPCIVLLVLEFYFLHQKCNSFLLLLIQPEWATMLVGVLGDNGTEDEGHDSGKLYDDVQRRTRSILQWITDGITSYSVLMST